MFYRLGTWCHDRRRLVLGLWVAVFVVGGAVSGAVGSAFRDEFNLPDVGVQARASTSSTSSFGGQGTGASRAPSSSRPSRASTTPRSRQAMEALFAQVAEHRRRDPGREPLRARRGRSRSRPTATRPGTIAYANVELPDDIDFTRAGEIRDEILDEMPEIDGLRGRARRLHLRRVRGAVRPRSSASPSPSSS